MLLKNKYVVGCHVMFYEIEMVDEYIQSCLNFCDGVENKENIIFDFTWNISEYLERIDGDEKKIFVSFFNKTRRLESAGYKVNVTTKTNDDPIYNIPGYRRDLNHNYCEDVDFVLWGETDSLFPKETLTTIESVDEYAKQNNINRYVLTFGYRKNWDDSWKVLEHPYFEDVEYVDKQEWTDNHEASEKAYMTIDRMNEINEMGDELDIKIIDYPKFDGSCLVIKSDVIKSGVNIPHSLLMCAEDTSFGRMAKLVLGDSYVQFVVKNILRVHNRRHPRKRLYIKDETNQRGYVDKKGNWWDIISQMSKHNEAKLLNNQSKFFTYEDFLKEAKK
jgi:hypothetical protein|tara:strand:+ start:5693 stop:6688 length:996 start_codon:yes stop_codon:yes gene_type:complete